MFSAIVKHPEPAVLDVLNAISLGLHDNIYVLKTVDEPNNDNLSSLPGPAGGGIHTAANTAAYEVPRCPGCSPLSCSVMFGLPEAEQPASRTGYSSGSVIR